MTPVLEVAMPLDLGRTFGFLRMGQLDPTCTLTDDRFTKTFAIDDHRVTRHQLVVSGQVIRVTTEGDPEGTGRWSSALAVDDGHDTFTPQRQHLVLRRLVKFLPGLRFVRIPWLFDFACGVVLQQRVRYQEAIAQYRGLVDRYGSTTELGAVFPSAHQLARLVPAQLQELGIDMRRATTLLRLAREHATHQIFACERPELDRRLLATLGVGEWTVGMLFAYGGGDVDAVPVGDLHLPHTICKVFANERRGDDARMLQLLEPYAGHRARVVRLILHAVFHAPHLLRP